MIIINITVEELQKMINTSVYNAISSTMNKSRSNNQDDNIMSVKDVAQKLGVKQCTIYSYVAKNIIPHVQPPRQKTYFLKSQESMKKYTIKTNDEIEQIALNINRI